MSCSPLCKAGGKRSPSGGCSALCLARVPQAVHTNTGLLWHLGWPNLSLIGQGSTGRPTKPEACRALTSSSHDGSSLVAQLQHPSEHYCIVSPPGQALLKTHTAPPPGLQVPDPRKGNDNSQDGSKWYKGRKANQNGNMDDGQASNGEQDGQDQEVGRQQPGCMFSCGTE